MMPQSIQNQQSAASKSGDSSLNQAGSRLFASGDGDWNVNYGGAAIQGGTSLLMLAAAAGVVWLLLRRRKK